jgi:hypothetical protein
MKTRFTSEETLKTIDGMIACGELVYNAELDCLSMGTYPRPAHRLRPKLLRDPRYVALRRRMQVSLDEYNEAHPW